MKRPTKDFVTKVTIDIYKPTSITHVYWVRTMNRGKAMRQILRMYNDRVLTCVNAITTELTTPPPSYTREAAWILDLEDDV